MSSTESGYIFCGERVENVRVWSFAKVNLLSRFAGEVILARICNQFSWSMNTASHLARTVHRISQFVWFFLSFVPSGRFYQGSIIKTHTETQTLSVRVINTKYCVHLEEYF